MFRRGLCAAWLNTPGFAHRLRTIDHEKRANAGRGERIGIEEPRYAVDPSKGEAKDAPPEKGKAQDQQDKLLFRGL